MTLLQHASFEQARPIPTRARLLARAEAIIRNTVAGDNPFAATETHRIYLHVGEATRAWSRCDGLGFNTDLHEPGDIDVAPAGDAGVWTADRPTRLLLINLCPTALSDAAERVGVRMGDIDLRPRFKARNAVIAGLAQTLAASDGGTSSLDSLFVDSLAIAMATQLLGLSEVTAAPAHTLGARRLRRVTDFIEANLDAPLQLADLAEVVGLSRAHFASAFRDATGLSPHRYVLHRRVSAARDLLISTRAPISQVALQTGFAHQSHLARTMKRLLGVTPGRVVASLSRTPA